MSKVLELTEKRAKAWEAAKAFLDWENMLPVMLLSAQAAGPVRWLALQSITELKTV